MSGDKKPTAGEAKAIRVASSKLITKEGTTEPEGRAVALRGLPVPALRRVRAAVRADGHASSSTAARSPPTTTWSRILDRPANQNYSSRAGGAAYCVADESTDAFRRFHAALFAAAAQRDRGASTPTTRSLIEIARQAGAGGNVPDCINKRPLHRDGRRAWPRPPTSTPPRPSGSTARTTSTARPTRWSPRSRRSSATCPGSTAPHRRPRRRPAAPGCRHPCPPDPRHAPTTVTRRTTPAEPTEAAADASAGVAVGHGQRGVGADRRRRRPRRGVHADDREDRDPRSTPPTCRPAASTRCCRAVR